MSRARIPVSYQDLVVYIPTRVPMSVAYRHVFFRWEIIVFFCGIRLVILPISRLGIHIMYVFVESDFLYAILIYSMPRWFDLVH